MSADIDVDWDQVREVAGNMTRESLAITTQLSSLNGSVSALLTRGGGLWMDRASPEMQANFALFSDMLNKAMANIPAFAHTFVQSVDFLQTMATDLAKPAGSNGGTPRRDT